MNLRHLSLINFRNYRDAAMDFHPAVNLFTGLNGSGKTNLLDAIHYLFMTRSYFNTTDSQNICFEEPFFMIRGDFDSDGTAETIQCSVRGGQKKQFRRNGNEYERLSDHIGTFPVVMIAPTDQELVTGGSELRRRFLDSIISQYDHPFLDRLIRYNQILSQRNTLLKQSAHSGLVDWNAFSIWDEQLCSYGSSIHAARKSFVEGFVSHFKELFHFISGDHDEMSLVYESHYNNYEPAHLIRDSRDKDLDLQYTTRGIHKDDLQITIQGHPARKFASQGQQKSLAIALKLAHFTYLCEHGFSKPVVLLDDIMDKLDENRIERLMELTGRDTFGQMFITDTHSDRLPAIFARTGVPFRHFHVTGGAVACVSERVES